MRSKPPVAAAAAPVMMGATQVTASLQMKQRTRLKLRVAMQATLLAPTHKPQVASATVGEIVMAGAQLLGLMTQRPVAASMNFRLPQWEPTTTLQVAQEAAAAAATLKSPRRHPSPAPARFQQQQHPAPAAAPAAIRAAASTEETGRR